MKISNCKKVLNFENGESGYYYSLPALEEQQVGAVSRLPVSIRVVLESVLRHCDLQVTSTEDVLRLAKWQPNEKRIHEIPFVVSRVILQDFTGVPLLADLAAMRDAMSRRGQSVDLVKPLVPVDLVVDHSVQVDHFNSAEALRLNMEIEFERNKERYQFLKWGRNAFEGFRVVPPGIGIVHQVNLEFLARAVMEKNNVYFPDSVVGTDSHTTMINGIGVLGWGVGGIEAESAMLGQPIYMLTPDVVGVHLQGKLPVGTTATDLVLKVTELLRKAKVVGKFVEFFGAGASSLTVYDRATISNMAPEYGATAGFFPLDEKTIDYLKATGRSAKQLDQIRRYYQAQGMFGIPQEGECDYTTILELDLSTVVPAVAGPARPQDLINLCDLKSTFYDIAQKPIEAGGYGKSMEDLTKIRYQTKQEGVDIGSGDVLMAAITSCTNTSNPNVMLAAGLLAKKAVERGIKTPMRVKTSLAPGSRVVTDYLEKSGLLTYLEKIGFYIVGYGCTTCIGNSGPLLAEYEEVINEHQLVGVSVLSGNRNFEARVHQNIRANFLMSPPLVVAFALAGRIDIDMTTEPLATDDQGNPVYLRDLWPSAEELNEVLGYATNPENYQKRYQGNLEEDITLWQEIESPEGNQYTWNQQSTYVQQPPFFEDNQIAGNIHAARALAIFGDSVTTDHISPAGQIRPSSPAGKYLQDRGVSVKEFNSYGARRGNHNVMLRGTFANVRIRNLMVLGQEGGVTAYQPNGDLMSIYDASLRYQQEKTPLIVFAGEEYGTGSSRDWAAKGTYLLGVRAVIAQSFERIHRSNLVGMGVLPCQFQAGTSVESLALQGTEKFDLLGLDKGLKSGQMATLVIYRADGTKHQVDVLMRVDTPIEVEYLNQGGILPYVLDSLCQ